MAFIPSSLNERIAARDARLKEDAKQAAQTPGAQNPTVTPPAPAADNTQPTPPPSGNTPPTADADKQPPAENTDPNSTDPNKTDPANANDPAAQPPGKSDASARLGPLCWFSDFGPLNWVRWSSDFRPLSCWRKVVCKRLAAQRLWYPPIEVGAKVRLEDIVLIDATANHFPLPKN